eukprot:scaffold63518_cov42-Cyclotella_meneghiniana.AAC.7
MSKKTKTEWCPIRDYFNRNGLDLSDEKRNLLVDDWGCDTVESLKLLDRDDWDTIFDGSYKKMKLRIADKLFEQLTKDGNIDLSKCANSINLVQPEGASAASATNSSSARKQNNHTDDHKQTPRLKGFGFTHKKKKKRTKTSTWDSPPPKSGGTEKEPAAKQPNENSTDDDSDDCLLKSPPPKKRQCNKNSESEKLLALPASDWRQARCVCVGECKMCVLLEDPADEDEKLCWDKELLNLGDLPERVDAIPDDFEDPNGFYATISAAV